MRYHLSLPLTMRIGRRGAMLLVLAAIWARLFLWPLLAGRAGSPDVFYYLWPIEVRAGLWALTITVAVVAAFVPPRADAIGWVALVIMPMQRLAAWAWGGATGTVDVGRAVDQASLYLLLVVAVWVAAAMRPHSLEPSETMEATGGQA